MLNPQPKPEPRKRVKARKQRHVSKVVKSVRQQCVERDGYCRLGAGLWRDAFDRWTFQDCTGPSEWAHLGEKKRFKTRGQAAEVRHATSGSLMLCTFHHREYDAGRLAIEGDNADRLLRFVWSR